MSGPLPVVVLVSGRGSNLRAIDARIAAGELPARILAVLSDREDAAALAWAAKRGLATGAVPQRQYADRAAFDAALGNVIAGYAPALVVLAGFMRILGSPLVERFAGRMLNIHPSLLPKYPGLHTHRRVLEAGDAEHGASVHFVTTELDGGPVVLQARVPVLPGDDEAMLAQRVLVQEHRIYPLAIRWFAEGRLRVDGGVVRFDGRPLAAPLLVNGTADAAA
ncbi:MAG TPA: phosphoribosylglycinamide formyltransferase [Steroidobacteraceae bacterium]|nr:phosphoribosylglycinamide formyltransferase [Steroidobacteraceae bacterium]